jgi:hypothetical protein
MIKPGKMRQTTRTIWIIIYFLALILLWKNVYIFLVSSFLAYTLLLVEYLIDRRNLRDGTYISVFKKNHNISRIILIFTFGLLLALGGLLIKSDANSWKGINSKVLAGVFFMLDALLQNKNSLFLLTDKALIFEGDFWQREVWRYRKLDKVLIGSEEIQFVKGTETESFLIEKEDNELIKSISDFLSPKLENRLFLHETQCEAKAATNDGLVT